MRLRQIIAALGIARGIAIAALLVLLLGSYFWARSQREQPVVALDPAALVVLRTPGGMLEVATLVRNEEFGWSTKRACPVIDCGSLFGATVSRIRVPAHYTYRVPLAATWTLKPTDGALLLVVPQPEVNLPVAVDLQKMELQTTRDWFSPSKAHNREVLLRELQPELARRALLPQYADAQREQARKTVAEFAQKWMREQGSAKAPAVKVRFADEGAGGI